MKKKLTKVLVVTYYWPPAGGPGVQRWLKFAKYLPEFGFEPVIYTPENPSYPLLDESLQKEVPEDITVIKTKIWEPYRFAEKLNKSNRKFKAGQFDVGQNQSWKSKLSIWIRGNFFIPDARVFWVQPSVSFLKKYVAEHQISTIITTGPPHSMHVIGLHLKQKDPQLKWIADFRDPWTEISYYKHLKLTAKADKKHRLLEHQVFKNADYTLATSFTDAENFRKNGANAICITNGFDESDQNKPTDLSENTSDYFTLSYIGVLEQLRNPEILWQTLSHLVQTQPNFSQHFRLKFVGRVDDRILHSLENSALKNNIQNLGYVSHDAAVSEMANSSVLLITNFPDTQSKGIIPGKIFEYLATKKQILSFGPKDADVSVILEESKAGKHFGYEDAQGVEQFILEQFALWKSQNSASETENIEQYSRRNLTRKLADLLHQLVH